MSSIWTIRRSASDAKLTGLCAGVAQHWGVDPVLVRVGCALLALSGGIGVVLYVAGWLLIPVEGKDTSPVDDFFGSTSRRWPKEVWITLIVIACLAVFAVSGSISPFGVGPAVVLAVIWYFGFYRNRRKQAAAAAPPAVTPAAPQFIRYPGPSTPFTQAAEAWQRRIEENARQSAVRPDEPSAYVSSTAPTVPFAWPSPPPANLSRGTAPDPVRFEAPDPAVAERHAYLATPDPVGLYAEPERTVGPATLVRSRDTVAAKRLRLVSLLAVGLALGGLAVADYLGMAVSWSAYLAAALAVVGLTLVAATWFGRARGILPIGILLAVAVLATTSAPQISQLDDWAAPDVVRYAQVSDLPAAGDARDVGRLQVDLSQLDLASDTAYRAHVDVGQLEVIVPADVNVVINYTVDVGVVRTWGEQHAAGTDLVGSVTDPSPIDRSEPTLTLDVSVDQGNLEVRR
ncbi:MAG TPA: PspC domain-containing protein [Propionibacteriaceae bacterium]